MKPEEISACYRTLRLPEGAGLREVKRAFHTLAAKYHPDTHANNRFAAEHFKNITRSYEMLKAHLRPAGRGPLPEAARPNAPQVRRIVLPKPFVRAATDILPIEELGLRLNCSDNRYVRLHAVRALTAHSADASAWRLVKALSDPDTEVRREAARALGAVRAKLAAIPLIYAFRDADFFMRDTIVHALAQIGTPLAWKFLHFIETSHQEGRAAGE